MVTAGTAVTPGGVGRLVLLAAPALVGLLVVANAWSGLMPGVGFWDTGEFQTVLPIMGTAHPTGYPTYVLLGFVANLLLIPIGEPAFRMNVLSLLAVAVAAGATVVIVRRLTGSTIAGVAAGLGLATTPIVWSTATRADPHPIHLAFMAVLLVALIRWEHARHEAERPRADRYLLLAAVVFGLSAGNHSLSLLFIPPIALYVIAVEPGIVRRPRFVAACLAAAAGTAALVFLELPIRGGLLPAPLVYGKPATWDGFWYIALAEQFRGSLGDPFVNFGTWVESLVALASQQLGLAALVIPAALVVAAARVPRFTMLTGVALVITVLFNKAYANAEIERYYLGPALILWAWLGIFVAEVAAVVGALVEGAAVRARIRASSAPPVVAAIVAIVLLLPTITELDARRDQADRSNDTYAARWVAEVLPVLEPDAVLVSWWSTSTTLWYAQKVEGRRPDVFIVDDRTMLDLELGRAPDVIRRYLAEGRPVYAIRLEGSDTEELRGQFDMEPVAGAGNTTVWKVHGTLAAAR